MFTHHHVDSLSPPASSPPHSPPPHPAAATTTAAGAGAGRGATAAAPSGVHRGEYGRLSLAQLKGLLRQRGMPTSGRKLDLAARLTADDDAAAVAAAAAPMPAVSKAEGKTVEAAAAEGAAGEVEGEGTDEDGGVVPGTQHLLGRFTSAKVRGWAPLGCVAW